MSFVCVYILKKQNKKKIKKKFKISKSFSKREKNFQKKKKKSLWTRGIKPLRHLKKKFLWTRGIGLPSDFFKKCPFFFQRFQDSLKSSFQNGT